MLNKIELIETNSDSGLYLESISKEAAAVAIATNGYFNVVSKKELFLNRIINCSKRCTRTRTHMHTLDFTHLGRMVLGHMRKLRIRHSALYIYFVRLTHQRNHQKATEFCTWIPCDAKCSNTENALAIGHSISFLII